MALQVIESETTRVRLEIQYHRVALISSVWEEKLRKHRRASSARYDLQVIGRSIDL